MFAPAVFWRCLTLSSTEAGGCRRATDGMNRAVGPILNTAVFTLFVPGTVAILIPRWLLGGFFPPSNRPLTWLGAAIFALGAAIYLRCAWEFAVRGLGTPAPLAPTKYLVTSALHRYVRNPMYLGVALAIVGEGVVFGSFHLVEYAGVMLLSAHIFVLFYEEPTLHRQFGESYDQYRRSVPRWIPRLRPFAGPRAETEDQRKIR